MLKHYSVSERFRSMKSGFQSLKKITRKNFHLGQTDVYSLVHAFRSFSQIFDPVYLMT